MGGGTGTVQLDQNPTRHSIWLKPSGLLFRGTLIFPFTTHRCLRRSQATRNTIPCISVGHTVLCSGSGLWRPRQEPYIYSSLVDLPFFQSRFLPASRKLYWLIFRFIRRKDQIFFLGIVILRVLTQRHSFIFSDFLKVNPMFFLCHFLLCSKKEIL